MPSRTSTAASAIAGKVAKRSCAPSLLPATHLQQVPGEAKAGDIGHRMYAFDISQTSPNAIERRGPLQHHRVALRRQQTLFQGGGKNADPQRLGHTSTSPSRAPALVLTLGLIHHAQADQTVDRFKYVD